MHKDTVIVHSGGMDSSICLALALEEFPKENILSLSFNYEQRHSVELKAAKKICKTWEVDHIVVDLHCLAELTSDALTGSAKAIDDGLNHATPSSLVLGRNGLMARLAAIHAHSLGGSCIYMGIMEEEAHEVGYRDCSNHYIRLKEQILRIDLGDPTFEIRTPLIDLRKVDTLKIAQRLGVLDFLLENTVTCYRGIPREGCGTCPSCVLKLRGIKEFAIESNEKTP